MKPIEIVDVIHHKNKYYTQEFFVLDRMPEYEFEKKGSWLIGEDSGFFKFYHHRHDLFGNAFAGRKFDLKLTNGDIIKAEGQYWDGVPEDYSGLIGSTGCGVAEDLGKCNVFCSYYVDLAIVEDARKTMDISKNYHKHDKRHDDFGKHTIESKWDLT